MGCLYSHDQVRGASAISFVVGYCNKIIFVVPKNETFQNGFSYNGDKR